MKANKIVFLYFPCMVVVCESCETPGYIDPETNDSREYARITRYSYETEHYPMFDYVAAGGVWFSKHATMLTDEQREQIKAHAAKLAEADKERINQFKKLRAASVEAWQNKK